MNLFRPALRLAYKLAYHIVKNTDHVIDCVIESSKTLAKQAKKIADNPATLAVSSPVGVALGITLMGLSKQYDALGTAGGFMAVAGTFASVALPYIKLTEVFREARAQNLNAADNGRAEAVYHAATRFAISSLMMGGAAGLVAVSNIQYGNTASLALLVTAGAVAVAHASYKAYVKTVEQLSGHSQIRLDRPPPALWAEYSYS